MPGIQGSPLRTTPDLISITFWEASGGPLTSHTFAVNGPELTTRLLDPLTAALSSLNEDFHGVGNESYDVFYSDAGGVFDINGDSLTIEAIFSNNFGGGGLNISEVQWDFGTGSVFGGQVRSFVQLGSNSIPGSQVNAVDSNLATTSTMGSTAGYPGDPTRLRITIGAVPEPSTLGLVGLSLVGLSYVRRSRRRE
jgi:hypothetical protein